MRQEIKTFAWRAAVLAAAWVALGLALPGCSSGLPPFTLPPIVIPTPLPNPTPTPVPSPTPKPVPTPEPTPVPKPTPTPPPPPPTGTEIAGGTWEVVGEKYPSPNRPAPLYAHTVDNMLVELTGCAPGSDCVFSDDIQTTIKRGAAILRAEGFSAGQFEPGLTDELAVGGNGDGTVVHQAQGYHIFNTGGNKVVWSTGADWQNGKGAYRDTWHEIENPPIISEPDQPVAGPLFPQKQVSKIDVKRACPQCPRKVYDATPKTGPDHAFCLSIGKDQDFCPLGPECDPATDAQCLAKRQLKDQYEQAAGPWTWFLNGTQCARYEAGTELKDNRDLCFFANDPASPFQVVVPAGVGGTLVLRAGDGVEGSVVVQP